MVCKNAANFHFVILNNPAMLLIAMMDYGVRNKQSNVNKMVGRKKIIKIILLLLLARKENNSLSQKAQRQS